jgi:hypothetical protein
MSRHPLTERLARNSGRALRPAVAIAAVAALAISVSTVMAGTSVTRRPVADTWFDSSSSTANGTSTQLRVDGSPLVNAFLKFDLSGTTGTITRAVLQLYPNSSSTAGLSVHPVASTSWTEQTSYSARPAMGTARVASAAVVAGSPVNVDVTPFVTTHGLVSLGVTANSTQAISLGSRESTHPPRLVVTFGSTATPTPTTPATPKPTATPVPVTPAPGTPTPTATGGSGGPTSANPIRATFYYPWFPEAWNQQGMNPFTKYHPSLGFYNGADAAVVAKQIRAMQYGKIQVGIASWWGQRSSTDVKVPTLLSTANGTGFKWAFYFELEGTTNPSSSSIASDLAYINSHYGSNPNVYKISGRPVIFVYGGPDDNCSTATRWAQANASKADYVILKVFPGYASCSSQPDNWHQYSPAVPEDDQPGRGFAISPGFNKANEPVRLARDPARWTKNIRDMVASREPWQLVTTFNEWGEGTAVESATEWATSSGYGLYLDALHNN